ncbi:hypothetical protein BH11CYA1_BH11CYA1_00100 [soil metagenome]
MFTNSYFWLPRTIALCGLLTLSQLFVAGDATEKKGRYLIKPVGYKALPSSAASKAGKLIFQKNNCAQCHTISGSGSCLGPVLAGVGGRRSKKFVFDRITAGKKEEEEFASLYGQAELMPHPRLPREQSALVVSYLMTLPEPAAFFIKPHPASHAAAHPSDTVEAKPTAQSIAEGKKLFYEAGCMSCHSIGKIGGQFAVELDYVGIRKGPKGIRDRLVGAEMLTLGSNDEYNERGTPMPPSNLNSAQIKSITDFLMSLPAEK